MINNSGWRSLAVHEQLHGKTGTGTKLRIDTLDDLLIAYTPGVAESGKVVAADPSKARDLTNKRNTVVVVTDGSTVRCAKVLRNPFIEPPFS